LPHSPGASLAIRSQLEPSKGPAFFIAGKKPRGRETKGEFKMARARGINAHKYFKLGKAAAKRDQRNLKFAAILRAPVTPPPEYDFDLNHPGIPTPMFGNNVHGDCVMAGRAHQTLRFEDIEQGSVISISEADVLKEYFKETGGADDGLVTLDSLKEWRSKGWKAGGRKYKIKAFAQINQANHSEVKGAVFTDLGVGLGLLLPTTAQGQVQAGKPWEVVSGPGSKPNSWGGHYVYVPGYTKKGPVCVTWGRKQQMTWAFIDKYCDEAYLIIDAINTRKKKAAIDAGKLNAFLSSLKQAPASRGKAKQKYEPPEGLNNIPAKADHGAVNQAE
jgi:hypothetical protein